MQMCEKALQISSTAMVCDTCRKILSKKKHQYYLQLSLYNDSRTSESEESEVFVQNEAITSLNIRRYS